MKSGKETYFQIFKKIQTKGNSVKGDVHVEDIPVLSQTEVLSIHKLVTIYSILYYFYYREIYQVPGISKRE